MAKILLVDDDQDFVEMNKTLLEKEKHTVLTAFNGPEGEAKAIADKPDLLILDVMMDTKNAGFKVARELRDRPDTKAIPIIMLTGVNQEVPFKFGPDEIWLPVDVFLEKPVKPGQILAAVKKVLK
jgi:CheY-like chemotaxis protein